MSTISQDRPHQSGPTSHLGNPRTLALGAILGPGLFTASWIILGFFNHGYTLFGTRIPSYSPLSQPISGLGMGRTAPRPRRRRGRGPRGSDRCAAGMP